MKRLVVCSNFRTFFLFFYLNNCCAFYQKKNFICRKLNPVEFGETESQNDSFAFYKISFLWYSVIGVITTWIPAIIISHLTGGQNFNGFNVQLLSPIVRHLVPIKYRHIELKTVKNVKMEENAQ